MSGGQDADEWWTTNHELIRNWADARGVRPVAEGRDGGADLRLERDPDEGAGEPISWEEFFDRFDAEERAFLYLTVEAAEGTDSAEPWAVVDRDSVGERSTAARNVEDPEAVPSNQLAVSDTGEGEPVTFERTETGSDADPAEETAGTTTTQDQADPESDRYEGLVVDEIREAGGSLDPGSEEYVTFENAGERPLDLSGCVVRNEAGLRYEFDDAVLDPGERLTLHSGDGTDTDTERYWGADDTVWANRGETVVVESASGERVVEERYKGGR